MEYLWETKPQTISEMLPHFAENGTVWKRQTLHTLLMRLKKKGLVRSEKHLFGAAVSRREYERRKAESIIDAMYSGSFSNFISAFTGNETLGEQERAELERLLERFREDGAQ